MTSYSVEVTPNGGAKKLILKGPWDPSYAKAMREQGINALELNYALGFKAKDLNFLEDLPFLEWLKVLHWDLDDVSGVHFCRRLRKLEISSYAKSKIDFSAFDQLAECALEWHNGQRSLFGRRTLEKLVLDNYNGSKDLAPFSQLMRLTHLSLLNPKIESLAGIEPLAQLRFLGLYNAKKIDSVEPLRRLTFLEHLEIEGSRSLRNVEPLRHLIAIRKLSLSDDGVLQSIKWLGALTELEEFYFYETTNIDDGDLNPLLHLRRLNNVAFRDRKHYSHTLAGIKKAIAK